MLKGAKNLDVNTKLININLILYGEALKFSLSIVFLYEYRKSSNKRPSYEPKLKTSATSHPPCFWKSTYTAKDV